MDSNGLWLCQCGQTNVPHILTIVWFVSTICWRRVNYDLFGALFIIAPVLSESCFPVEGEKYNFYDTTQMGQLQILWYHTEGKITNWLFDGWFFIWKKPWLHAHSNTYSDLWFLVMNYTWLFLYKHVITGISVTMNSIYSEHMRRHTFSWKIL